MTQLKNLKINTVRLRSTLSLCPGKPCLDQNSLDRGQCYLLWCNVAKNSTQRGQYYAISGSKIVALIEVSVTCCSITLKKLVLFLAF